MALPAEYASTQTTDQLLAKLEEIGSDFLRLMELPAFERAELLNYLEESDARVEIKSNAEAIKFDIEGTGPNARRIPFLIPGKTQKARAFPLRVAVYVASHLDYWQFGGRTWAMGERGSDGIQPVVEIAARGGLLSFKLLADELAADPLLLAAEAN